MGRLYVLLMKVSLQRSMDVRGVYVLITLPQYEFKPLVHYNLVSIKNQTGVEAKPDLVGDGCPLLAACN